MATIAEQVAGAQGDDGLNCEGLEARCDAAGGVATREPSRGVRWDFPDGSSIVMCNGAWDLGIVGASEDCWCWEGADDGRHADTCADVRTE